MCCLKSLQFPSLSIILPLTHQSLSINFGPLQYFSAVQLHSFVVLEGVSRKSDNAERT